MKKDLSLYVHIPFCKTICLYCNFLTFAHKNKWIPEYVDAVVREIRARAVPYRDRRVVTVYFGGGTPSLIEPLLIKKIIHQIKASFSVKKDIEISIECNPESVDARRLLVYQRAGVTRISLGVQSFNKKTLWRIARPHDRTMIFRALDCIKNILIKNSVAKNFGADFIIGLPGQTLVSFQEEVETILSYTPTHLSFYFLSYDTKKIDLFIKECPDEEAQIAMYEWLCGRLRKAKFVHYEVSNWARRGYECVHNKCYWEQKDYLGLGIGAHSIVDGVMEENGSDFDEYLRDPLVRCNAMAIDTDLRRMEYVMLRLRTNKGIDLPRYAREFGAKARSELLNNAKTFIKTGHLKKNVAHLVATEKGFLILEMITKALI